MSWHSITENDLKENGKFGEEKETKKNRLMDGICEQKCESYLK